MISDQMEFSSQCFNWSIIPTQLPIMDSPKSRILENSAKIRFSSEEYSWRIPDEKWYSSLKRSMNDKSVRGFLVSVDGKSIKKREYGRQLVVEGLVVWNIPKIKLFRWGILFSSSMNSSWPNGFVLVCTFSVLTRCVFWNTDVRSAIFLKSAKVLSWIIKQISSLPKMKKSSLNSRSYFE